MVVALGDGSSWVCLSVGDSSSNSNSNSNSKSNSNSDSNFQNSKDPNSQDSKDPKDPKLPTRWRGLRILLGVLGFVLCVFLVLGYAISTDRGTQFLLQKIVAETGVVLSYDGGNLRDGVWVSGVSFAVDDDIRVLADKAYVQIGWLSIFEGQVHLHSAKVDRLQIVDKAPPSDTPFAYKPIDLPIHLRVDQAAVSEFRYESVGSDPVALRNLSVRGADWAGSRLQVAEGALDYEDVVQVRSLSGSIAFESDYLLDVAASVTVPALSEAYFDPLQVQVGGSLKRTIGSVVSRYNQARVTGDFVVEVMEKDVPLSANVQWQSVLLPYASDQKIRLNQGQASVKGVAADLDLVLEIQSQLSGKDIPSGDYQGQVRITKDQMQIERLLATVPQGKLAMSGVLDWSGDFFMQTKGRSDRFDLRAAVPKEYQEYAQYLPQNLDGDVAFDLWTRNQQGNFQIKVGLDQNAGEHLNAVITEGKVSAKSKRSAPWYVEADWQGIARTDFPNVGQMKSPKGKAKVVVQDDHVSVQADLALNTPKFAPIGDYQLALKKQDQSILIDKFNYQGKIGSLTAQAEVNLAQNGLKRRQARPLTWQINAQTSGLDLQAWQADIPIRQLVGSITAQGQMTETPIKNSRRVGKSRQSSESSLQRHLINLNPSQLSVKLAEGTLATLPKNHPQTLTFNGEGQAQIALNLGKLSQFNSHLMGQVSGSVLPKGQINAQVEGDDLAWDIKALNYAGEAGKLEASAQLQLGKTLAWQAKANFDRFNSQSFLPDYPAVLTGKLTSAGKWNAKHQQLGAFDLDFAGDLASNNLPSGQFAIKAQGDGDRINLEQFEHQNQNSQLIAKGAVSLKNGVSWDIDGQMKNFNLAYFAKDFPSRITGKINTSGQWSDKNQRIRINEINLNGTLKQQALTAQGRLFADLKLPKNLNQYLAKVKQQSTKNAKSAYQSVNALIREFNADNLAMRWGENYVSLNGQILSQTSSLPSFDRVIGRLRRENLASNSISNFIANATKNATDNPFKQSDRKMPLFLKNPAGRDSVDSAQTVAKSINQLEAKVNLSSLDQLYQPLRGEVSGGLTLMQSKQESLPTIYVDLLASGISLPQLIVNKGSVKGKIVNLANQESQLAVVAKDLQIGKHEINELGVLFSGTQADHSLSLNLNEPKAKVKAVLKGGFDRHSMQWLGVVGNGEISSQNIVLKQQQPVQVKTALDRLNLQVAAHCWQTTDQNSQICFGDNLVLNEAGGQVNVNIKKFNTKLFSAFLPNEIDWQAQLNGKVVAQWQKNQAPKIDSTLYTDNGNIKVTQEDTGQTINLPYQRISLIAQSVAKGLQLRYDINTGHGAKGYADIVVNPYEKNKPISGALVLNELNLAVFKPFFPGLRVLEGNVTMAGGLGGELSKPLFYGDVKLENGRVATLGLPVNVNGVSAVAKVRGTQAEITGGFNSGSGSANITGLIDWQKQLQIKLGVTGKNLLISQPPLLVAQVNPDINIIVKPLQQSVNIEGAISIPTATIRPPEASEDIVSQSDDVVVLDRRLIGNLDEVLAVSKPWQINADIGVDLGDNVNFRGFGAVLPLAGAINITQRGQAPMQGLGVVQVSRRTNVNAFGQSLELNYAQIRFNGNIKTPNLSIESIKEIEGKTVGIRVKGQVTDPNITVFNNAGLTEQQAMNAIVTGKLSDAGTTQISEQGFKSEVTNNLAAAGLSLGLQGTRNFTNQIGRAFGLQSLTVDASGSQQDTSVNVTGYITPDLYIRYGVGVFNAQSSLSMRYQLTNRIYVEATSAVENIIDVVYRWQF